MCSTDEQGLAGLDEQGLAGLTEAIDQLAAEGPSGPADTVWARRVDFVWALVEDLDPGLGRARSGYGAARPPTGHHEMRSWGHGREGAQDGDEHAVSRL